MNSFEELSLPAFLSESLRRMKFEKPTPVQEQSIPVALQGRDVVASAETGSGKTAAFGIPLLAFLDAHRDKTALVLIPTRELADQVRSVLDQLSGGRPDLRSVLLIGGVGMGNQVDGLRRGARLIIGTPGRINDHLERRTLDLSKAGYLVLDEADRMLDMGFAPQLDRIRKHLSGARQTLLFSATIPPDIQSMAAQYLKDPVRVAVGTNAKPVETIHQALMRTSFNRKMDDLMEELKTRTGSVLIFGRTQHRVDRLSKKLKEAGFSNVRIHGGRTQGQRRTALEEFKSGGARIMVATDIAARGLDISHIAHVINYDLPQVAEDYVHRVGRTARAGTEGEALTLLTPEDQDLWKDILKTLGDAKSALSTIPSHFTDHAPAPPKQVQGPNAGRSRQGGRPHGRPQHPHHGSSAPSQDRQEQRGGHHPQGPSSRSHGNRAHQGGRPQEHSGRREGRNFNAFGNSNRRPDSGHRAPTDGNRPEPDGNRIEMDGNRREADGNRLDVDANRSHPLNDPSRYFQRPNGPQGQGHRRNPQGQDRRPGSFQDGPRHDGRGQGGNRHDGRRRDGNRQDGNRKGGNRFEGNRADGNRRDGNRRDDSRGNAPRRDGRGPYGDRRTDRGPGGESGNKVKNWFKRLF